MVKEALDAGSFGIAYTYNEPFIWYEFVLECAELAREHGLCNVLVTNGLYNPEPFERLAPLVDAMNIDVKSMQDSFYQKICKSHLAPVLATCRAAREAGIHLEITNLLIPTLNDAPEQVEELVRFMVELGRDVPLHFSAYFPCYKMTIEPTPLSSLLRAREIAEKGVALRLPGQRAGGGGQQYTMSRLPEPAGKEGRLSDRGGGDLRRPVRSVRPPRRLRLLKF